jgi:hypothetical protein
VRSDRDERDREKVDRGRGHRYGETYREKFRERTVTKRTGQIKRENEETEIKIQRHRDRYRGHPYQG